MSVEKQDNSVLLELKIPQNLYYFQGHFTNAPVLPGVALTHWVLEYINEYFDVDSSLFQGFKGLKFQIIICPGYTLKLKLSQVNPKKYSFSYSSEHGQHSSGKVLFV